MGGLTSASNPIWLPAAILRKWIWHHNSADDHRITTKFGRQMHNGMPMTIHRSKSKPEIQFQYGGRQFSETGSSYILAVDWGISSKFGTQIDFHLLKQIPSLNVNPEVHFDSMAAILNNRYDVITPPTIIRLLQNLAGRCKMVCRWPCIDRNRNGNRILIWRPPVFRNRK